MLSHTLESKSVQRLQNLLKSRYGKGLEVRYIVDASDNEWSRSEASVTRGNLVIPIQLHGVFLGMATVPSAQDLPESSIKAITDVVRLILEPSLYGRYLENRANQITYGSDSTEALHVLKEETHRDASVLLLVSSNPNSINRTARLVHEDSGRWAFLSYSDMKCHLGSVSEIKTLGKATIFIEDILLMSPEELEVLTQYLNEANAETDAMIVIGSSHSFAQLQNTGHYPAVLLDRLAPYVAELERWPADEKILKQALELLIQPLALSGL